MPATHASLFHARILRERLESHAFPQDLADRHQRLLSWVGRLRAGDLDEMAERKLHGEFLVGVFGEVLGYRSFSDSAGGDWELMAEQTVSASGKSADGVLGFFGPGGKAKVIVPIELKGASQSLDHSVGGRTPVEQAWDYANFSPGCRWVIVSNYRETRLYSRSRTPGEYEVFFLDELEKQEGFKRFSFLLAREQLLPTQFEARSPLDDLLTASEQKEEEVTSALYREYRGLRQKLHVHLGQVHSNLPAIDRLRYTQTILDRILFIAFAEDRGLLPSNTIATAITHRDKYRPRPVWQNLVAVFRWIDEGDEHEKIPAYDGGLFKPDEELERLELSDAMCRELGQLASYDFREDVSVEVLGHIFEQSILDLEEMRAEAQGQAVPKLSKRKAEGVYYTPSYITRFIVEETLGQVLSEKWQAALAAEQPELEKRNAKRQQKEIAVWERYRDALKETRVLDPACGSGAFLIAAFDLLAREYERVNAALAAFQGGQAGLFRLTTTVLNQNLFGVDVNPESVEITKLSLWLKTCARGSKLTYLDRNIKCGNSIISDIVVHERAFDWKQGTLAASLFPPETAEDEAIDARWREGFDVVIGNPPYVRQELLSPYKGYLQRAYRSYHGVADIYVYFFERGLSLLKKGGWLGFITSNSWLQANYATALRAHLRTDVTVKTIIDLGDSRIFGDAPDVRPAILIARGSRPEGHQVARMATFGRGEGIENFAALLADRAADVSIHDQPDNGWQIGGNGIRVLLKQLLDGGLALSRSGGLHVYYGVKSGKSGLFEVDQETRDALVRADPKCEGLLKKLARGEHLRPWYQEDEGKWLVFVRRGTDIEQFPAVKAHLVKHREELEPRPSNWPAGQKWGGRKPGAYKWYEIQDTVDYFAEFDKPKIVYPDVTKYPRFSWDDSGRYLNNLGYFIPTDDKSLLALLQSRVSWFVLSQLSTQFGERAGLLFRRMFQQNIERLPIPEMPATERRVLGALAMRITESARTRYEVISKTRHRMADLVPAKEKLNHKLTEWWKLDFNALRDELKKALKTDIALRDRDDWETLWRERRGAYERLTAAIVAGEIEMNERIYRVFGLGPDEVRMIEEETKYPYGEM